MSLLELIVAMALGSLLGLAMLQLFNSGARLYARGQARADLQASGLIALTEMAREARDSAGSTATIWSGTAGRADAAVSFRPDGRPGPLSVYQPQEHVVFFREQASGRLIRTTVPVPGTGTRLTPEQLRQACQTPGSREGVVCAFTRRLGLELTPTLLTLTVDLEQPLRNGVTARASVETRVAFRNRT